MPSVYELKPRFQGLLRPIVRTLARGGVTANQVTVAAAVLSVGAGTAILAFPDRPRMLLLLPAVLLVRMALNAIDGMLAREHNQQSRLGAVLNELGDVVSDAALYLPLAAVPGFDAAAVIVVVLLAAVSELAGVLGVGLGTGRRYDGPMGKSDRAVVFGGIGLAAGLGLQSGLGLRIVLWACAALLVVTIVNRARSAAEPAPEIDA